MVEIINIPVRIYIIINRNNIYIQPIYSRQMIYKLLLFINHILSFLHKMLVIQVLSPLRYIIV